MNCVYKSILFAFTIACSAEAEVRVENVVAAPISPWGKVYIQYDVSGTSLHNAVDYVLLVTASNHVSGVVFNAKTLTGDISLSAGRHKIIWDCEADSLDFSNQDLSFAVIYCPALYQVIDLSGGPSASAYPVATLGSVPASDWTTEYKMSKLVLRRIEPGTFKMCGSYDVTLTKPYYIGVFEVTQTQYGLVTGASPSWASGAWRPVEQVSWDAIKNDFIHKLQEKTGLLFDLPTEAQWEYACRAGTTTTYSYGNSVDGAYMLYLNNTSSGTIGVGAKLPNPWGLYDMHGNVWEWCCDWYGNLCTATDPEGPSSGSGRVIRGGAWSDWGGRNCTSSSRSSNDPSCQGNAIGFRLSRTL